jgi:hypothetical protein
MGPFRLLVADLNSTFSDGLESDRLRGLCRRYRRCPWPPQELNTIRVNALLNRFLHDPTKTSSRKQLSRPRG